MICHPVKNSNKKYYIVCMMWRFAQFLTVICTSASLVSLIWTFSTFVKDTNQPFLGLLLLQSKKIEGIIC